MVFLFHSVYVCSKYEDFLFRVSILAESGIFFNETSGYFLGNSMVVKHILYGLSLPCHTCYRVCLPIVTYDWLPIS